VQASLSDHLLYVTIAVTANVAEDVVGEVSITVPAVVNNMLCMLNRPLVPWDSSP
jgi:hypothetical protein